MRQSFLEFFCTKSYLAVYLDQCDWLEVGLVQYLTLFMLPVKEENMILNFAIILSQQKIEKQFKSSKTLELTVDMVRSRP